MICAGRATNPWEFKIILGRPHARFNARLLLVWWLVLMIVCLVVEVEIFLAWVLGFHKYDIHRVNED